MHLELLLLLPYSSLMLACYAGHLDVVKYLRRHGASWETRDLGGCTALHWAADGGHCSVIEWMIKDGCEVRDLPSQPRMWHQDLAAPFHRVWEKQPYVDAFD